MIVLLHNSNSCILAATTPALDIFLFQFILSLSLFHSLPFSFSFTRVDTFVMATTTDATTTTTTTDAGDQAVYEQGNDNSKVSLYTEYYYGSHSSNISM